jgi:hypothetical protein
MRLDYFFYRRGTSNSLFAIFIIIFSKQKIVCFVFTKPIITYLIGRNNVYYIHKA